MNRLMAELIETNSPKFTPEIVNGLACIYIPYAMQWLDARFRSAAVSFPEGLKYLGCERCTPEEEFYEATKPRNNKRVFDLAESDIFLIKMKFTFRNEHGIDEPLPDRFIYLPFVGEAGIFKISGTMYHITGVLADKVISPGQNSIFVRLIRDKLSFFHTGHSVMVNENRETFNIVWSGIYRKQSKEKSAPITTKCQSSIAHYLFIKYGFEGTFERYLGFVPKVGRYNKDYVQTPGTILCRSSYLGSTGKPSSFIGNFYHASDIYLEIPKEQWNNKTATLVSGFFYVVDHFPDRFVDRSTGKTRHNDTFLWSVLLGHVIFSGVYSEASLNSKIEEHFNSLNDYLDLFVQNKLKEIGWNIETFYDLIAKIMFEFPTLLIGGQIDSNSMFSKTIEILYYVLAENAFKIFKVNYSLRKAKNRKPLTYNTVKEAFNKIMSPRAIFKITKDKMVVETVSYCGDHKYPKLTAKVTEQETGSAMFHSSNPSSSKKSNNRIALTVNNHINKSMVEAGNVLFLSKSNPMPNTRLNPYVKIDIETGTLIPDQRFVDSLNNLQEMLTNLNNNHDEFENSTIFNDHDIDKESDISPEEDDNDDSDLNMDETDNESENEIERDDE